MKQFETVLLSFGILLPFLAALVLPVYPYPAALKGAREAALRANNAGDIIEESMALETVVKYSPWQAQDWQRLGRLYLDLGRFEESLNSFAHAVDLQGLSVEGQVWYADALARSGRENEARDYLRGFSLTTPVDPFVFLQSAVLQRSLKDLSGALVTLLRALEVDPQNGELNYQTGLLLIVSEPDQSLPFLQRAVEFSGSRVVNSQSLIDVLEEISGKAEGRELYVSIGQELATIQEWDMAQRAFEKAVDLDPLNAEAMALLAEASQQNGEAAGDLIDRALQLDPHSELVNGLSGLYYRRQGNYELAMEYLLKASNLNPEVTVWEMELGNTYDATGNLSSAFEHFQKAAEINPAEWQPWRALAEFCLTRNYQLEEVGLPAARKALQLYGNSPALMDLLGTILMTTGKLDEALSYFQLANDIDPHQTPILIHLGQLYLLKEDLEHAGEYLQLARDYAKDERLRDLAGRLMLENGLTD